MSTAAQSRETFRPRRTRGLATMRDIWDFAQWVGDRTGQNVVVEGVERVRAGHLDTRLPLSEGMLTVVSKPAAEVYRPRRRGLVRSSDLQALGAWLKPALEKKWRSDDKRVALSASTRPRLPMSGRRGLVLRSALLAFFNAVGQHLGFAVTADDISGMRDTGAGLHVSRRVRGAGIVVSRQPSFGYGKICAAFTADDPDDGNVVTRVTTYTYESGSVVETWTASSAVQGIGPGGTFDDCADVDFDSTGSGSGALLDVSTSDTVEPWDSVIAAAEAEIAEDGPPVEVWSASWEEAEWRAASAARSEFIDDSSSDRSTGFEWEIAAPKFQIENTGQTRIEVEITFTRVSDSEQETIDPIIVEPGETSDWIDTRAADPGDTWSCHITRVGIGGF